MRTPTKRFNPLGSVLSDVLQRVDPELAPAAAIWAFWNDEVGATVARRAQPAQLRNRILFVTVASHSWMQELQFMKETLRERLNARLGTSLVQDIYFVSGSVDAGGAAPPPEVALDPAVVQGHLVALPQIANPDLAAACARVVEARARRLARARPAAVPARRRRKPPR